MDTMNVVTLFLFNIVLCNIPLLYGTVGEILTEKAGSLNLGVEGTMAVGAIFGYLAGCACWWVCWCRFWRPGCAACCLRC